MIHYNDSRKKDAPSSHGHERGCIFREVLDCDKTKYIEHEWILQIVNQCSGAVNAISGWKRRDLNKSYAAQKVLWDQFRENQGSLALKLDFQKPEDYISIVYYYISEI